ncbi:hypothetical protein I203_100184 [Kwoniella mangroviensis CBS 8507]|uniref:uncharacterized protein n=1 Tax=Kwoniella mangroviensis CBS 8507 TaxID=1296122 RepID=UPI00080D3B17|nr:heme oxygenase 2 [Kwoniella mangroviensis CBS 8507]OCF62867.1 heme oxygenase 2 [Kwoniella mangroviensis CBS 8507]
MKAICPFANLSIIQPPPHSSSSQLHLNLSSTPSSSSPIDTPSFSPNTPTENSQPQHSARGGKLPGGQELDLNQPVSTLLKLGTQRAHVKAEHSAGAAALVQGGLGSEEYIRWLAVLWRIYDTLELGLAENSSNPVLAPTYDPALLARAPALAEDISYLLTLLPSSSSSSSSTFNSSLSSNTTSLPPFAVPPFLEEIFVSPPEPLSNYINHLKSLSTSSSSSSKLLAHSYVRYLGDLSGGQFIGARVKKSYDLSGEDGTKFYYFEFQNRSNEGDNESKFDAKKRLGEVKDWFRKGMDEGVGEDQVLKADLVEEANIAFSLNTDLFSVIRLPSSASSQTTTAAKQKVDETESTAADRLNSIVWFLVAAGAGVLLNVYVQPIVSDWISGKRNGI